MTDVSSSRWARWIGLSRRSARWQSGAGWAPASDHDPHGGLAGQAEHVAGQAEHVAGQGAPVDPSTPLFEVPFVVLDVETTGGSPTSAALTEIAAARYQGGECLGVLQTLVDPQQDIPPLITILTGISDPMVQEAPRVQAVLPSLIEFVRGAVVVGHNVSFDMSFLNAALVASGREPLTNQVVDTLALARRMLRPDVPNCRLATLARELDLEHRPTHRALEDVRATADLLHGLIERASGYGVFVLAELIELPSVLPSVRAS
ncbi:MAG TPA: exonuclease domain-containing protein [Acidimicrobiales bacterium]|nr:exonuclease domain-containing protein [Acidimicrobiales bacterium]